MFSLMLSDKKTKVTSSPRKAFAIGFITSARSFIKLGNYLFTHHPEVKYLLAYKLSQDHIETLFSKIRSSGGFNNNPDVVQFTAALKRLLMKHEITSSSNANCLDLNADSGTQLLLRKKSQLRVAEGEIQVDPNELQLTLEMSKPVSDIVEYIGMLHLRKLPY